MIRSRQVLLAIVICGALVAGFLLSRPKAGNTASFDPSNLVISGTVTRVIDGDTIDVQLGSGPERVRFFGIDAPEARQPYGREATNALRRMLEGQQVELRPLEDNPNDAYDRLIAVVYLGDTNVNESLVEQGYAWAFRRYLGQMPGDEAFCKLEANARERSAALWSQPAERQVPPWIYRARSKAPPGARVPSRDYSRETVEDCIAAIGERPDEATDSRPTPSPLIEEPSGAECRIKGNINGKGDKIYHLPGRGGYDKTKINTSTGERWFCTEQEAQAAGWRAPR